MPAFAWALVLMVVSSAISTLMVKRPKVKPASEDEIDFPQEEEGTPQAVQFGDGWSKGFQVIWHGNLRTKKIKQKGKK